MNGYTVLTIFLGVFLALLAWALLTDQINFS
jgi:hypothetical protein